MRKYSGKKEWSETPVLCLNVNPDFEIIDDLDCWFEMLNPPFMSWNDKGDIGNIGYKDQFFDKNEFITDTEDFGWGYDDRI